MTKKPKYILGISAYYHDSAACLIKDGEVLSAVQEERFTRIKHDWSFPHKSVEYCLKNSGITINDLDVVAFYDKPFLKFERILETYLSFAPLGWASFLKAIPVWIKKKVWVKQLIQEELSYSGKILFPEHHLSHAASSFYPSPFKKSAFLTVDGVGEWTTTSFGIGEDRSLKILSDIHFPHSLGLLYSAFTYYTGFKVNSGEYKVMGLAPYGNPVYKDLIYNHLIDVKDDGSFRLNMKYFNYCTGSTMTNHKFSKLFGGPPRKGESAISQREMDLARSVQEVIEEVMLKIVSHIHKVTRMDNLCLAGGVALNCVANGRILREGPFKSIWIQPAAGDAGGALGAALYAWHVYLEGARDARPTNEDTQKGSYLGPEYSDGEIKDFLSERNIPYTKMNDNQLSVEVAKILANEKVVGWFQGRMEFGPRALGNRSILGDARSASLQKTMNLKIKYRESFRPFAPSVLRSRQQEYFELQHDSPYMLLVAPVKKNRRISMTKDEQQLFGIDKLNIPRSDIPSVTHVDYSARVQSVTENSNKRFYDLLQSMNETCNSPIVINTSFNVRGEPIVESPEDAYRCFMRTEMDYLVLGNFVLNKKEQPKMEKNSEWMAEFALD